MTAHHKGREQSIGMLIHTQTETGDPSQRQQRQPQKNRKRDKVGINM